MKFIVSTANLLNALQTIGGVIRTDSVLQILEDFLFDVQKNKLTITATDLEISMITEVAIESKDAGRIAIPAKLLVDTLKTLPEQPLVFNVDPKNHSVEMSTETGKYKLSGDDANDFPKLPEADRLTETNIGSAVLTNAFAKTLIAVGKDELRPALTGVLFHIAQDGLTFVSTDAHKLVKLTRTDVKSKKNEQFIVPKKAVQLLKNALQNVDTTVNAAYNKANVFFSFNNTKLIARLIDGNYPDYNSVIPTDNPLTVQISRMELLNTMKRISLYSSLSTYQAILSISGSEVKISTEDKDFNKWASERLSCEYDGEDIEIGFNAKFLIDILSTLDSGDIDIDLSTPTRAGILRPTDNAEDEILIALVMPVMIHELA